jgi:hypothetical protein
MARECVEVDGGQRRAEVTAAPIRTVRTEETGAEHEVAVLTLTADGGLSATPAAAGVLEMGLNREFLLPALDAGGGGSWSSSSTARSHRWPSACPTGPGTSAC